MYIFRDVTTESQHDRVGVFETPIYVLRKTTSASDQIMVGLCGGQVLKLDIELR